MKCLKKISQKYDCHGSLKNVFLKCACFAAFISVLLSSMMVFPAFSQAQAKQQKTIKRISVQSLPSKWGGFSERQKLKILEKLIKIGQFDLVQRFLDETQFSPKGQNSARFYQAALYKNTGRYKEAAMIYRDLLVGNPKLHRVRLELGHTLFLMKDDQSAKHHLNLVLGAGTSVSQQQVIRAFLNAIDKRKRWNVNAFLTVAPSTNINQGTDNRAAPTLEGNSNGQINDISRRHSGIGLSGGMSAGVRLPVTDNLDMVVSTGGYIKKFKDERYDDMTATASFGPRLRFTKGYVALYGTANRRWFAQKAYSKNFGANGLLNYRLTAKDIFTSNLIWQHKKFDVRNDSDGDFYQISAQIDHYLNSHSFIRTMGTVSTEKIKSSDTHDANMNYKSWAIGLGLYKELPYGVSIYAQGKYTKHDYEGNNFGGDDPLENKRLDLLLQFTKRDWDMFGYAPSVVYNYAKSESNSVFHQFDSHSVNFTLSKNF